MAVRTSVDAVIKILDPDGVEGLQEQLENEEVDFTPFLETANALINQVCLESGYTEEYLELIERWLSAHFFSIPIPKTKQEAAKGLTETTEGQTKLGFNFTRYGQQAMLLDYDGNLASLNEGKKKLKGKVYFVGGYEDYERRTL